MKEEMVIIECTIDSIINEKVLLSNEESDVNLKDIGAR